MSQIGAPGGELIGLLPLPLAQLYRRALNAKSALDRHHNAYYLAEAALKLAACLRIGVALSLRVEPESPLTRLLETLCLPSTGHWVSYLRDTSDYLRRRPDAALLPLADAHDRLLSAQPFPPIRRFAERVARAGSDEQPPLTPEQVRDPLRQGALGFFNLVVAYRNQVFGHGSQRPTAYYEEVGPLLLEAVLEVLRLPFLFGGLHLAVPRLELPSSQQEPALTWQALSGPASLPLRADATGPEPTSTSSVPGQLYFVGPGVRVPLHPLAVYQEDRSGRERVGFLNRAVTRKTAGDEEVHRCEYLDYATGDPLREIDARRELTRLLAQLRGREVTPVELDRLIATSVTEQGEVPTTPAVPAGAVLGDFVLEGELGRGGMGVVYRARQRALNRAVALKVLPPALAVDPVALARFRRETAALARCDHPNLVKILTSGSDGERHYYAMELVEGTDLGDLFVVLSAWGKQGRGTLRAGHLTAAISSSCERARRRREASAAEAADLLPEGVVPPVDRVPSLPVLAEGSSLSGRLGEPLADAAAALVHLHERGILHRDIKPGNLMLTADGRRLVLMDLGLARLNDEIPDRLTRTRQFLGTLRYSSPEQVLSATTVDGRSDVYSLGATLWELLTLQPLYGADAGVSDAELIRRIQFEEPGRIRAVCPEVPAELEAIVLQCLEKDPRRRYATARELADDLGRWQRGETVRARRLTPAYRLGRFLRRRSRTLVGLGVLLLAVGVGYLLLADASFPVPGGEGVRRQLDRHAWTLFRPVPNEAAIRRQAADMRVVLGRTLVNATPERPGWWSSSLERTKRPYYDAWTQGQTTTALLRCPETDAATRDQLASALLELFAGWEDHLQGFEDGYGFHLFRITTTERLYPSGIGTAWALPAVAGALAPGVDLEPARRRELERCLARLQEALDRYQIREARSGRPAGAWRLYVDQEEPDQPSIYVTATVFLGLLELKKAGLPWRGDQERVRDLLHATEAWALGQFDGRGWQCTGGNGNPWNLEYNDGLTLWMFALLLRAEAEDDLVLPDAILKQIPRHLADCGTRRTDYPTSVNTISHSFRYKGKLFSEETRVVRLLWYPWAVETAARWLTHCQRVGAPRDEQAQAQRVLNHLVCTLGPQVQADATVGQTFVPTETLLGLSAVPVPE